MVSISTKIGMFTMFSTMALGRELTGVPIPVEFPLQNVEDRQILVRAINELYHKISDLESKQIVSDKFYTNNYDIEVYRNGGDKELHCFFGYEGQTLDLIANVTTDDEPEHP